MMRPSDARLRVKLASDLSKYFDSKVEGPGVAAPAADGAVPEGAAPNAPEEASPDTAVAAAPQQETGLEAMIAVSANHLRPGFNPTPSVHRYEPVTDSKIEEYGLALLDGADLLQIPDTHLMGAVDYASERFDKQILISDGSRELTRRYVDRRDKDKVYFVTHSPSDWSAPDQDYHALMANEVAFLLGLPASYMRPANAGTDGDTLFIFVQSIQDAVVGNMLELEEDPQDGTYDPVATFEVEDPAKVPEHVLDNVATMIVFDWVAGINRLTSNALIALDRKERAHFVPIGNGLAMVDFVSAEQGFGGKFIDSLKASGYLALLANEVKAQRASLDGAVEAVMSAIGRANDIDFDKLERRFDEDIMQLYVPSTESNAYVVYGGFVPAVQDRADSLAVYKPMKDALTSAIKGLVL
jgi:hypothetical protein